jgi:CheY-like chemotaxis protein
VAKVLLVGLGCETNDELTRVLESNAHVVVAPAEPADAVFCSADRVSQMVHAHDAAPVIVVTGEAATEKRLDALDYGAANYCSEPLEESEVLWTLASVLRRLERPE